MEYGAKVQCPISLLTDALGTPTGDVSISVGWRRLNGTDKSLVQLLFHKNNSKNLSTIQACTLITDTVVLFKNYHSLQYECKRCNCWKNTLSLIIHSSLVLLW